MGSGILLGGSFAVVGGGGAAGATWSTTNGADKNSAIVLSNGNLTPTPDDTATYEGVRASRAGSGTTFSYTFTSTGVSAPSKLIVGIDAGTTSFATAGVVPGRDNNSGVAITAFSGNFYTYSNSGNSSALGSTPSVGQVLTVQCDTATSGGTVVFKLNGTTIATITGVNALIGTSTWKAFYMGQGPDDVGNANFGSY